MGGGKADHRKVVPVGGADRLHQIDQRRRDRRIDAEAAADDQRKLGGQQRIGGRRERVRVAGHRRRRLEIFRIRHLQRTVDLLLLNAAIQRDVDRPARRRQRRW